MNDSDYTLGGPHNWKRAFWAIKC